MESQKESLNLELVSAAFAADESSAERKSSVRTTKTGMQLPPIQVQCCFGAPSLYMENGESKRKRDGLNSCQLLRAIRVQLFVVMRFKKKSYGFLL